MSVEGLAELVDHWWNLKSLLENGTLSLKSDVFGPLDETSQVSLGLHILANTEVLWSFLEKRVLNLLGLLLLDQRGSSGDALSF